MTKTKKDKLVLKLPLIIGAFPFLLAGIDSIQQQYIIFGSANLFVAFLNLISLNFVAKHYYPVNIILSICNALLSFFISYNYYLMGKKGLPYAWIIIGIGFIIASIIFFKKIKEKNNVYWSFCCWHGS